VNMLKMTGLWLAMTMAGCTHMRSVSTTSIPAERDTKVEAEGYRFMFLLMNFSNDYVDGMAQDLAKQCPDGRVEGILTKQENITYFPWFAHGVRVTATGYCIKSGTK